MRVLRQCDGDVSPGARQVVFLGEFLAHYESLTKALIRTATMGMLLLWYFVVFELAFCDGVYAATCASAPYQKVCSIRAGACRSQNLYAGKLKLSWHSCARPSDA